jgi:hypothetical protein
MKKPFDGKKQTELDSWQSWQDHHWERTFNREDREAFRRQLAEIQAFPVYQEKR